MSFDNHLNHNICSHSKSLQFNFRQKFQVVLLANVFMSEIEGVLGGISVSSSAVFVVLCKEELPGATSRRGISSKLDSMVQLRGSLFSRNMSSLTSKVFLLQQVS